MGLRDKPPSARPERVVRVDDFADPRWDAFVEGQPDGLVYHHSTWMAALAAEYGISPFGLACESSDGRLVGVLPLCFTKGLPMRQGGSLVGRRLASLPRTPIAGPLAESPEAAQSLLQAAKELLHGHSDVSLQVKVLGPELDGLVDEVVAEPWRPNYRVRLHPDPVEVRFGSSRNHGSIMRAVRKAERAGVQLRYAESEAELREWYDLYLAAMRSGPALARPYRLFLSLWKTMRPRGYADLLLAERVVAGRRSMLAGCLLLRLGSTVFFGFNGRREEDLEHRPNEAIHWRAIQDSCRAGFQWYDFGEADEGSSLAAFKSKWATDVDILHRYYFPRPRRAEKLNDGGRSAALAKSVWRRLPLRATSLLSDRVYRYL